MYSFTRTRLKTLEWFIIIIEYSYSNPVISYIVAMRFVMYLYILILWIFFFFSELHLPLTPLISHRIRFEYAYPNVYTQFRWIEIHWTSISSCYRALFCISLFYFTAHCLHIVFTAFQFRCVHFQKKKCFFSSGNRFNTPVYFYRVAFRAQIN